MTDVGRIQIPVEVTGADQAARELGRTSKAYDDHAKKLEGTSRRMGGLRDGVKDMAGAYGVATTNLYGHARALEMSTRGMHDWGMQGVKAGALGVGAFALATRQGMKFDQVMSGVKAATGAQGKEFQRLRDAAIDWGSRTQFSATEVADSMVELGKAGYDVNETLDALPGTLDAAAASGEQMATVTGILVDTLTPFHLGAEQAAHVTDALAYAANETTSSIGELGEAMKYVAPVAAAAGIEFDETNAALLVLAKNGIKGSMAGTTLRGVLQSMSAPNKRVQKEMDAIGLSFRDVNGDLVPLGTGFDRLQAKLEKMPKAKADQFLARMFGRENIAGAQAFLAVGGEGLDKFTEASKKADGAAADFAATLRDNLGGDVEEFGGKIESAAITVTDDLTPALRGAIGVAGNAVDAFMDMDDGLRKVIVTSAAVGSAGVLALGAFGVAASSAATGAAFLMRGIAPLAGGLSMLGTGIASMTLNASAGSGALYALSGAMLANPLLTGAIVVGGIVAAGIALSNWADNGDRMRMSAEQAAAAVNKLDEASRALAGTNLSQKEADLQQVVAVKELSAARKHLRDVQRSGKASAAELEEAQLGVAQAELRVERAAQGAATAREENTKTINAMRSSLKTNRQVLAEEAAIQEEARAGIKRWGDAVRDGSVDAATGNREIARYSKALKTSQERAGQAQAAIANAADEFRDLGPAAKGSADEVREIGNLLAGLPKDVRVNVTVMTNQINNRPAGAGTYAPPVPNYGGGGGRAQGRSARGLNKGGAEVMGKSRGPSLPSGSGGLNGDAFDQGGSQTYLGAIAASPTLGGLLESAAMQAQPTAGYLEGSIGASQSRAEKLIAERKRLEQKLIPPARARVAKAKAALKKANAAVKAANAALKKAKGKSAIAAAKKKKDQADNQRDAAVRALDAANDNLQKLTGRRDETGVELQSLASDIMTDEQALEELTATRDADGNIVAYGAGAIAGIQSDPAGLQASIDAQTAAANAAENLRREALGMESLEEEARRAQLNAIRVANGLPPLAPGQSASSAAQDATATLQAELDRIKSANRPGQAYQVGVGFGANGAVTNISGLTIQAGSYAEGQAAAQGFLDALGTGGTAQAFQSNTTVVR